ncbi:hypothetical protein B0A48_11469 [Cryoendolithus antarcticus]|uniref:Uncharacterized protein n=1 Tax=Cryoendolithus antarcticus TaxID=1507870 RepID=A0A1V8SVN8_9PEZI|nr:hypothetical protein B0A48_11469 [Cryoendolithus antarcticus]
MAYFVLSFALRCLIDIGSTWPIDWTAIGISLLAGFALASWFVDAIINDDPGSFKVYAHFVVDKCAYISSACHQLLRLVLALFGLALSGNVDFYFDKFNSLDICFDGMIDLKNAACKDNARHLFKISTLEAKLLIAESKLGMVEQDAASAALQHEADMRAMSNCPSPAHGQLLHVQSTYRIDESAMAGLKLELEDALATVSTRDLELSDMQSKLWGVLTASSATESELYDLQVGLNEALASLSVKNSEISAANLATDIAKQARYKAERKFIALTGQLAKCKVPASKKEEDLSKACERYILEIKDVRDTAREYSTKLEVTQSDLNEQSDNNRTLEKEVARLRGLLGLNSLAAVGTTAISTPPAAVPGTGASLAGAQAVGSTPTTTMQSLTAPNPQAVNPRSRPQYSSLAFVPASNSVVSSGATKAPATMPTIVAPSPVAPMVSAQKLPRPKVTEPQHLDPEATSAAPRASSSAANVVGSNSGASARDSGTDKWQHFADKAKRTDTICPPTFDGPFGLPLSRPLPHTISAAASSTGTTAPLTSITEQSQPAPKTMALFGRGVPMALQAALAAEQASTDVAATSPSAAQERPRSTAAPLRGGMQTSRSANQPPSNAPTGPSRPNISRPTPRPHASGNNNGPGMKPQSGSTKYGLNGTPQSSASKTDPNKTPVSTVNGNEADETPESSDSGKKEVRRKARGGHQVRQREENRRLRGLKENMEKNDGALFGSKA